MVPAELALAPSFVSVEALLLCCSAMTSEGPFAVRSWLPACSLSGCVVCRRCCGSRRSRCASSPAAGIQVCTWGDGTAWVSAVGDSSAQSAMQLCRQRVRPDNVVQAVQSSNLQCYMHLALRRPALLAKRWKI